MAISDQTSDEPASVRVTCAGCDGTGMRGFECGPPGATWTDYERCPRCNGRGFNYRRI
jgi:DnaJ-class molecular chaperone